MEISNVRETTLGGNQWLEDYLKKDKYQWKLRGDAEAKTSPRRDISKWEVKLYPMEIRTFIVTFNKSH